MTDIKRAILGDHEAAKRLTEVGVLLECPFCGGEAMVEYDTIFQAAEPRPRPQCGRTGPADYRRHRARGRVD